MLPYVCSNVSNPNSHWAGSADTLLRAWAILYSFVVDYVVPAIFKAARIAHDIRVFVVNDLRTAFKDADPVYVPIYYLCTGAT